LWIERTDDADGSDESVAFADHGFKEPGLLCMVGQRSANFADDVVEVPLNVNEDIGMPQRRNNFFTGDELLAPANQEDEKFHGLPGELYPAAGTAKLVAAQIKLNLACIHAWHKRSKCRFSSRLQGYIENTQKLSAAY
jgi:hypothetical protein